MIDTLPKKFFQDVALFIIFIIGLIGFFSLNIYMLAFKDTNKSYSITRSWQEYHSLNNWNMPNNVHVDIDNDSIDDDITYTGCAILSSIPKESIDNNARCNDTEEEYPKPYITKENENKIGQQVTQISKKSFRGLPHTFIVETYTDEWRLYKHDLRGVKVYTFEETHGFIESKPSLLDYVDSMFYQFAHIFTMLLVLNS